MRFWSVEYETNHKISTHSIFACPSLAFDLVSHRDLAHKAWSTKERFLSQSPTNAISSPTLSCTFFVPLLNGNSFLLFLLNSLISFGSRMWLSVCLCVNGLALGWLQVECLNVAVASLHLQCTHVRISIMCEFLCEWSFLCVWFFLCARTGNVILVLIFAKTYPLS